MVSVLRSKIDGGSQFNRINPTKDTHNNINFKSEEQKKEKELREDIYSKMPLRALGYTNELGEALRPVSPILANLSWLPAIGYIGADIADKYKQDEYAEQKLSKGRASKEFVNQMLASVLLPTAAVKTGQFIVNNASAFGKTGLNFNTREQISDIVINSIKSGEHKNFLNEEGKVDIESYKKSLASQFDEIIKHRKTHKKLMKPVETFINFIKHPFIKKPSVDKVKQYSGIVAERMIADRQQLLSDIQPNALSNGTYKKFMKITKKHVSGRKTKCCFQYNKKIGKRKNV